MRYLTTVFLFFSYSVMLAQIDSLILDEVRVYGIPVEKFAVGQKVMKIDSKELSQHQQENLSSLLNQKASIYMKMYGSNMASTIALRGTGPSHTAVIWNGLEISSITLGQTDFSLLPVYAADEISIHFGGASSLYGSGAIGGAVNIKSVPDWEEGLSAELTNSYGSWGTYYSGAKVKYAKNNIEGKTKFYYTRSANDFSYDLPSTGEEVRQINAAYQQYGLQQDITVNLKGAQQLSINGWFASNYREVQPVIGSVESDDNLEDQSVRVTAAYHNNSQIGYFVYQLGYLNDWQLYNESSAIETYRWVNKLRFEKKLSEAISLQTGVLWNHINAKVDSYQTDEEEERVSAFALLKYSKGRLDLSLNARQTFVTGYDGPIAPSLGLEYRLFDHLSLTAQVSRNYRVPTLNDRYWEPGGNLEVNPEEAYNAEGGLKLQTPSGFSANANYYKMWVDDWIIWLPEGGVWSPQNINKVHAEGVELNMAYESNVGDLKVETAGAYSYSKAITKETFETNRRSINKQIPYTPEHTASLSINMGYGRWNGFVNTSYTGQRFTDSNNSLRPLENFVLLNVGLNKSFKVGKHTISGGLQVNNLLDERYQTLRNRAMPGRNLSVNLIFKFNKPFKNNHETN